MPRNWKHRLLISHVWPTEISHSLPPFPSRAHLGVCRLLNLAGRQKLLPNSICLSSRRPLIRRPWKKSGHFRRFSEPISEFRRPNANRSRLRSFCLSPFSVSGRSSLAKRFLDPRGPCFSGRRSIDLKIENTFGELSILVTRSFGLSNALARVRHFRPFARNDAR